MNVNLEPLYQQVVNPLLLTVLSGVAVWLGAWAKAWLEKHAKFLSEQTDATLAGGFNRALQNGVAIFGNSLEQYEGAHDSVAVKSWVAAKAAQYAIDSSPDFMARFTGMTPQGAAQKALAYLPAVDVKPLADAPDRASVITMGDRTITLGKPSPADLTDAQERAETAALNVGTGH